MSPRSWAAGGADDSSSPPRSRCRRSVDQAGKGFLKAKVGGHGSVPLGCGNAAAQEAQGWQGERTRSGEGCQSVGARPTEAAAADNRDPRTGHWKFPGLNSFCGNPRRWFRKQAHEMSSGWMGRQAQAKWAQSRHASGGGGEPAGRAEDSSSVARHRSCNASAGLITRRVSEAV